MDLERVVSTILWMSFSLYFLWMGIKLFKRKTVIFHFGQREKFILMLLLIFLYNMYFEIRDFDMYFKYRNKADLIESVVRIILLIIVLLHSAYRRLNDVIYKIYNVNEEDYKEILKKTLNENFIEFSITNDIIKTNDTPAYIEFITNGFQIKKYKKLPNYQKFLKELETNLKENEVINYDIVCAVPLLTGIILTLFWGINLF